MDKQNQYSEDFRSKPTDELVEVLRNFMANVNQKLAAIWELNSRGELPEEFQHLEEKIFQNQLEDSKLSKARNTNATTDTEKYRTFGLRFFAMIIDGFILGAIAHLFNYLLQSDLSIFFYFFSFLDLIIPFAYYIVLHGLFGQTVGKMLMAIKLCKASDESADITMKQAFLRDAVPFFFTVSLAILGSLGVTPIGIYSDSFLVNLLFSFGAIAASWNLLEILTMLFSRRGRALHDLIAGTVVIKANYQYAR